MNYLQREGIDFYFNDDGLMVFTREYHLKRGWCCGNGCLHCPFDYVNVPEPKRTSIKSKVKIQNPERENPEGAGS